MNIAMFTNVYKPFVGGVPVSIERLAKGLRDNGHNVYVFAPEYPQRDENEDDVIRCRLITFYSNDKFDIPVVNLYAKDLKERFMELDIDVVHVHHPFWMGTRGVRFARLVGVPVVFTYHTRYEEYLHNIPLSEVFIKKRVRRNRSVTGVYVVRDYMKYRVVPRYLKHFMKKCDAVIFPTESMREWVGEVDKTCFILPTGLGEDAYISYPQKAKEIRKKYIGNKKYLLISVSRITKEKNIGFMIKALKTLKGKIGDSFRLLLVGYGDMIGDLEELARSEEVADNVVFAGQIDNELIPAYYGAADLFVFASKSETQGIVLLEAMAQGLPVVAVNATGVRDLIENGVNGYLTRENKNDWSRCIAKALGESDMREEARFTAIQYRYKSVAKRAEEIYTQVIEEYEKTTEMIEGLP